MKDFPDEPRGIEVFEPRDKERDNNFSGYYIHDRGDYIEPLHCRQAHHKIEELWKREGNS